MHVARIWKREITQHLIGKPERASQFGSPRLIKVVIFKQGVSWGLVSNGSGQIPRAGCYEQVNQISGSCFIVVTE